MEQMVIAEIDEEEEKQMPAVVIKSHLKRKPADSGTDTASEWDEKESQT